MRKPLHKRKCRHCGAEFIPTNGNQQYCNAACRDAAFKAKKETARNSKPKEIICCAYCGKEFVKSLKSIYCSENCRKLFYKNGGIPKARPKAKPKPEKKESEKLTLSEISKRAFEEGLSYGQYVQKYGL